MMVEQVPPGLMVLKVRRVRLELTVPMVPMVAKDRKVSRAPEIIGHLIMRIQRVQV